MIVFWGDTHAEFDFFPAILEKIPQDATIIQVGDFGYWPDRMRRWDRMWEKLGRERPIYFIDGNHEYHPNLSHDKPTEVWKGLIHIPRGHVEVIDGKRIAFFGGAFSPDRIFRKLGRDYFLDEVPSQEEFQRLLDIEGPIDMMVTHTAPESVINAWFPHLSKNTDWKLPLDWYDPTSRMLDKAWDRFGRPPLVCGHMHKSIVSYPGPVRILDAMEIWEWRDER